MEAKRKDSGVMIDIALIVLVLAIFSSFFASDLLAKYRSGDDRADTARVSSWNVDMSAGARIEVLPDGDGSVTYPITFINSSETAALYNVTIVFDQSMAGKIVDPRLNGAAPTEGSSFTSQLTFPAAGTLPAASAGVPSSATVNLTFRMPAAFLNSFTNGADYDNDVINGAILNAVFTVSVQVEQVD